jgi:hypothetical protein
MAIAKLNLMNAMIILNSLINQLSAISDVNRKILWANLNKQRPLSFGPSTTQL